MGNINTVVPLQTIRDIIARAGICGLLCAICCAPEIENYNRFGLTADESGELVEVDVIPISDATNGLNETHCTSVAESPEEYITNRCSACHADNGDRPLSRSSLISSTTCDVPLYNVDEPSNSMLLQVFAKEAADGAVEDIGCMFGGVMTSIIANIAESVAEQDCLRQWLVGLE